MNASLRFGSPAAEWLLGLPLANGSSAAMLWGEADRVRLGLNHTDFWRAYATADVPECAAWVRRAQELMLRGEAAEANRVYLEHAAASSLPRDSRDFPTITAGYSNSYQPLGELQVEIDGMGQVSEFRRELDLERGVAVESWRARSALVRLECFVALRHDLIYLGISSDVPLSGRIRFARPEQDEYHLSAAADQVELRVRGHFDEGVSSAVLARLHRGGDAAAASELPGALKFSGREIELRVAVDAGQGAEPEDRCRLRMAAAEGLDFDAALEAHAAEHRSMFGRVSISLGDGRSVDDTDELVRASVEGRYSSPLSELVFHMGRYLLMSTNRAARRPANLQGLWNDSIHPEFDCNWHFVANLQMCHFLVNAANLDECNQALFSQIERFVPQAREMAQRVAGCRGVLFGWAAGGDRMAWSQTGSYGGLWTGAAAWLGRHYWQHYEFTRDRDFLARRAYPFLKDVGLFYRDWLVRGPSGRYVAGPTVSLEHPASNGLWMNVHCSLDTALVRDTMRHLLEAGRELGLDRELWAVWQDLHDNVEPYRVNREGQLAEWPEPLEEQPRHGIYAHLYALFPGDEITREATPELFGAARKALELRDRAGRSTNYGHSYPYMACLRARLGDGDGALQDLHNLARAATFDNLLTSCCEVRPLGLTVQFAKVFTNRFFQVDAALAATAAVIEMLLQSQLGVIRLLPALPREWGSGSFTGLQARGAFEVDASWSGGRLREARIRSRRGGRCSLALPTGWGGVEVSSREGRVELLAGPERSRVSFETAAGREYLILERGDP